MNINDIRQERTNQRILAGLAPVHEFPPVPVLSPDWSQERPLACDPSWWERVLRAVGIIRRAA